MVEQTKSGVYGIDGPRAGVAADTRSRNGRLRPSDLQSVWQEIAPNLSESRKRILFANDVTMGRVKAPVPKKFRRNRDVFGPMLPQQITVPLHNRNVLGRKEPVPKRYTSGTGVAALNRATRIEQWTKPMLKKLMSWSEMIGMLQDEAEMAAIVVPAAVRAAVQAPAFTDDNGDPIKTYWRDAENRAIETYVGKEHSFKPHRKLTAAAHEEALRDYELHHPALEVRLVHATDCVPIGLRHTGDGPEIDGLLIRTQWSRSKLVAEFEWLEPSGESSSGDVTLYEGWFTDDDGHPYVVYSANGYATRWRDSDDDATVDLYERFGMRRLLAFYEEGWHRSVRDPDMRGIPFAYPFASSWLAAQAIVGGAVANLWTRGYGARGIVPNRDAPKEAYLDGSAPRMIKWEPGGDMPVLPGEVVDLIPQAISGDAWRLIDLLMGGASQEGPPPGAFGGEGPDSGRERTVMRRHMEDAEAQIFEGGLRMYRKVATALVELGCAMTERFRPIPVSTNIPLSTQGERSQARAQIVTLDPTDVGDNYEMDAVFLPKPGENLAVAEQAKGFVQAGLRPRRWFHEDIMGDESPEQTEAEITSDHMIYGEEGQAEIRMLAQQIRGRELEQDRQALAAGGQVGPMSGTPMAVAGGLQGPQAGAPPQSPQLAAAGGPSPMGTGLPSPGGASLGGQVAAEMETGAMASDARMLDGGGIPGG